MTNSSIFKDKDGQKNNHDDADKNKIPPVEPIGAPDKEKSEQDKKQSA